MVIGLANRAEAAIGACREHHAGGRGRH